MRHKKRCHEHMGKIAFCLKCDLDFTVSEIVQTALNVHHGSDRNCNVSFFPEGEKNRQSDRLVCKNQKNFKWAFDNQGCTDEAKAHFAANALVNLHRPTHATRCFKKGSKCHAHIPREPWKRISLLHCNDHDCDVWSDVLGLKENRFVF